MTTTAALPPHVPPTAPPPPTPDAAPDVEKVWGALAEAKEDYTPPPPPEPEAGTEAPAPEAAQPAGGNASGGSGTGADGAATEASEQSKRTAGFIIMMYNRLQGNVFSSLTTEPDRYPPDRFMLSESERKEAADYLALGLEESGSFKMPWWAPLLVVLGISAFNNWQVVSLARKEAKRRQGPLRVVHTAEPQRRAPQQPVAVVVPTEVVHPNGTVEPLKYTKASPAPAAPGKSYDKPRNGPPCSECGKPCRRGRVACSKTCASVRTHRLMREKKKKEQQTQAPAA